MKYLTAILLILSLNGCGNNAFDYAKEFVETPLDEVEAKYDMDLNKSTEVVPVVASREIEKGLFYFLFI